MSNIKMIAGVVGLSALLISLLKTNAIEVGVLELVLIISASAVVIALGLAIYYIYIEVQYANKHRDGL